MDLQDQFKQAVIKAKSLPVKPTDIELLQMHALFKQATEGDVHGEPPASFDAKAMAKYNSWQNLQGTSKEAAIQAYCTLVEIISERSA